MGKTSTRSESKSKSELHKLHKFQKKLEFYAKVRDAVASLSAQKSISKKNKKRSRQKKLKAYDLSSLSDFLPELKEPRQPAIENHFKLNCKSRQKLILKEGKQLSTVLHHPAFHLDTLSAIHQHLQSTQPIVEKQPKKKVNKNGSKKKKEKKSKAPIGPQPMDI